MGDIIQPKGNSEYSYSTINVYLEKHNFHISVRLISLPILFSLTPS